MGFRRVARVAELLSGELRPVVVDGVKVVVVRIADELRAYADRCAHLGVELSKGALAGTVLTCSAHHWQYDALTGCGVNPARACLVRYALEVRDGVIYVDVGRRVEVAA